MSKSIRFLNAMAFSAIATALTSAIAQAAPIVVAVTGENVPFEYVDGKGQVVGFEVDLIKLAAARMGNTVEFTTIPFNGLFSAVKSGRADVAISSITITPKRLESVAFTQPYFDSTLCLAVRKDSPVQTFNDLKGLTMGVVTGTTPEMWVTANQEKLGLADVRRHDSLAEPVLALGSGRIDALVQDCPMIRLYLKDKPGLRVTDSVDTGEKYAAMGAPDSKTLQQLNDQISTLKQEGKLNALYQQWFNKGAGDDSSTVVVLATPK